jgi:sporulation protein YlmC with PRC-barrel domain
MPNDTMDTMNVANRPVEADETNTLISSEKVDGTAVYDMKGEKLGSIHHLMIDKFTGHVEYAVMSFGGFLGIGENYYPIPWRKLTYDTRLGGYRVDLDRTRLDHAPAYAVSNQPDWSDRAYRTRINEYWVY